MRHELGVSDDTPVIGFVGRLVAQKAPEVLVRAFANIASSLPNAVLAMVGSGPLEEELRLLCGGLGIAERVLFLGERPASGVLAAFDIFALPSRNEGLPYVLLEAMAAGLPIVATSTAGVELLLTDGLEGTVVPPDDVERLAAALGRLADDANLRTNWGRAARVRVADFTVDAMVNRTLAAYRRLATKPVRSRQQAKLSPGLPT